MEQYRTTCASAFCVLVLSHAVLCESLCRAHVYTIYIIIHHSISCFRASICCVTSVSRTALRVLCKAHLLFKLCEGFLALETLETVEVPKWDVRCHETCKAGICSSKHWQFQVYFWHVTCLFTFTSPKSTRLAKRLILYRERSMKQVNHQVNHCQRVRVYVAHSALLWVIPSTAPPDHFLPIPASWPSELKKAPTLLK